MSVTTTLPTGVTAAFVPNPISSVDNGTSALTLTTTGGGANNTPAGTYPFTVQAVADTTKTTTATLVVNACAQTLTSIAVTLPSVTVTAGNPADYTTTLTTNGGGGALNATMSVTTTLPAGVTVAFVPNPISSVHNGSTSALTLTTTCGAPTTPLRERIPLPCRPWWTRPRPPPPRWS